MTREQRRPKSDDAPVEGHGGGSGEGGMNGDGLIKVAREENTPGGEIS